MTLTVGARVTITPHRIWSPVWGYLDAPCVGEQGVVSRFDDGNALVTLDTKVLYTCRAEHLSLVEAA